MASKSDQKVAVILEWLLDNYLLDGRKPDQLEFDASYLAKLIDVDVSMLPMVLDKLERREIIKNYVESGEDFGVPELTYLIFFPTQFKNKAETYLSLIDSAQKEDTHSETSGMILYLDADGNFWHGNNPAQFCYSMDSKSKRYDILKYLIENKGYQSPSIAIQYLDTKTTKTFRSEIGKIRENIKKYMGIDGSDLIQSRDDSGYRINPKYKIFLVKKE